jgi:DNA polymerase-2
VARLRAGQLDDRLVYRRALRKGPETYTTTTPPHVVVARKTGKRRGRISYVMTTAGPQPAEAPQDPFDYEHYLDRQIGAVAEPVLALLGLEFADFLGTAKQLRLF